MSFEKERMYNPDIKEEFLLTYENNETQTVIAYIFYKSKSTEELLKKDLYEFSIDEIEDVLFNMNPLTKRAAETNARFISSYIDWAISKGLVNSNINPMLTKGNDWFEKFVDKNRKIYFSEQELNEMIEELVNASDAVILRLLFEGAGGEGLSELLNLTKNHIKFDNVLVLEDDKKGIRELKFSEECMRLIKQALKEKEYQLKNGTGQRNNVLKLVENDYVIRPVQRRSTTIDRADKHLIYRRIATIKEYFGLKYLTAKNIQRSGMIKMAKDLFLRDRELKSKQLYEISERFGIGKIGSEYYNISILKEFINRENIKKLYGIDIGE